MKKLDFSALGQALIEAGREALRSNSKLVASHGIVSLTDAGVRLTNGQFGSFLSIETPQGNFAVSIAKGSPVGASQFEIRQYIALEDIVEMERGEDNKWVVKEGGRVLYQKDQQYFRAIAVIEEEEE